MNSTILPPLFLSSMKKLLPDEYEQFVHSLNTSPVISIRKNYQKINSLNLPEMKFDDEKPIGWCEGGYYLQTRPFFTMDPIFHSGGYYVQ